MKLIVVGITFLAVLTGVILLTQTPAPTTHIGIPGSSHKEDDFAYLLTTLSQRVFAQSSPDTPAEEIPTQSEIKTGALIRTGNKGRAVLESTQNHVVTVDENSEFIVAHTQDTQSTTITVKSGRTWSRIKKLFDQDEQYNTESQNAIATVRGTSFSFGYKSGITTLLVAQGLVAIIAKDPHTGIPLPETYALVPAGKKAIVDDAQPVSQRIRISNITKEERHTEWYRFNTQEATSSPLSPSKPTTKDIRDIPQSHPSSTQSSEVQLKIPALHSESPADVQKPMPLPPYTSTQESVSPSPQAQSEPAQEHSVISTESSPHSPQSSESKAPRKLQISDIKPNPVEYNPDGTEISFIGIGFAGVKTVQINEIKITRLHIVDDTTMTVTLDGKIGTGTHALLIARDDAEARTNLTIVNTSTPNPPPPTSFRALVPFLPNQLRALTPFPR
ncbi:MAG: hypothetical protein G01um101466_179 [Parcubacteria group bacterium Gr01-1014_66]|nr:MAG: hypothetical protein G01um101466_179 [Parcubacteria group bacterium Gr01-1014_66]